MLLFVSPSCQVGILQLSHLYFRYVQALNYQLPVLEPWEQRSEIRLTIHELVTKHMQL